MTLRINGAQREVPSGVTLEGLVKFLELQGRPIAIELNGEVIPKPRFPEVTLKEGDALEVVTFVGGG